MRRDHRFSRAGFLLGGALLVTGFAARADWLVLTDGSRVETRGPWKEKGKLVVFTRADGTLASLRGSEVDLAASRKATEARLAEAAKPAEVTPAAPPKKLAVITDKDLPRRLAPAAAAATPEKSSANGGPVTVLGWKKEALPTGDGIVIVGTLQNLTDATATNLGLDVSLADEKGALLATAPGLFPTRVLAPKGSVEFRATFQGVVDFTGVKFDARGWAPESPAPAPSPDAAAPAAPSPGAPPPAEGEAPPPPIG